MDTIPKRVSIIIDMKSFVAFRAIDFFHLKTTKISLVPFGFSRFSTDWAFHANSNISIEQYILLSMAGNMC